jgi:hypothetical protein
MGAVGFLAADPDRTEVCWVPWEGCPVGFLPVVIGCLLIDIVKRGRETRAAFILACPGATWGRKKQRSQASLRE